MDIKDSYLHGTVGVVKSISVDADILTYNLADSINTARTITLPLATITSNGLMSSADRQALNNLPTILDTLQSEINSVNNKTTYKHLVTEQLDSDVISSKTIYADSITATTFNGSIGVANNLVLKINSGSTEGTDLYTFNGSFAKTLDIKQGSNIAFTTDAGSLTINAEDTKVTQTITTTNANYRLLFSATADDTTRTESAGKATNLMFNPSTGTLTASTFIGNLDGTYIHALTNYVKATEIDSINATDSLNTALGKLELKADFIYNDLFGTDSDDIINKWSEIVDFIDSVAEGTDITDEFVTRKTAQTITGVKTFSQDIVLASGTNSSKALQMFSDSTSYKYLYNKDGELFFDAANNTGKIWRSDNDGSGSELDADLLDGYHASSFMHFVKDSDGYVNASFLNDDLKTAASTYYIEFWDSTGGWFNSTWGKVTATTGFVKSGYTDDYVLLAGGGHKALSSLTASGLISSEIVSSKAFSLSNASWTDTGYAFTSLVSGTYAVQVTSGTNLVASGTMSIYQNLSDTAGDEIPLHVYGTAGWRPYLRTYANKLQISSNDTSSTSRTVTIKITQIL